MQEGSWLCRLGLVQVRVRVGSCEESHHHRSNHHHHIAMVSHSHVFLVMQEGSWSELGHCDGQPLACVPAIRDEAGEYRLGRVQVRVSTG